MMLLLAGHVTHIGQVQAQQNEGLLFQGMELSSTVERVNGHNPGPVHLDAKKNRGGARWYDIIDAIDQDQGGTGNVYNNDHYNIMWSDSTMLAPFSSGTATTYSGVWIKSVAAFFDPADPRYNDKNVYGGAMQISRTDAYTIDSLFLPFIYRRNPAKAGVVDTLIVSVIRGAGNGSNSDLAIRYYGPSTTTAANHGTDTLRFLHGFLNLTPGSSNRFTFTASAPANVVNTKIPLTTTTAIDTLSNGFQFMKIPVNLSVPAGNYVAASITFKSGDTWMPNVDTLYLSGSATPRFNYFRFCAFEENSSGYQTYIKGYYSQSSIMKNDTSGWGGWHIPSYAFTNTTYEHQWFQWKASCATCGSVGINDLAELHAEVDMFPVPANDVLNLSVRPETDLHALKAELFDLRGQLLRTEWIGDVQPREHKVKALQLRGLTSGMYLVRLTSNEGVVNRKVSLQR